jgi:uncharacterized membrane protein YjjP (DUF1212 family)
MPQLIEPYNVWFMGLEAAAACAIAAWITGGPAPSMASAVVVLVLVGSWNYYVQHNLKMPNSTWALINQVRAKMEVLQPSN